uniref:Uncharacterized protein n=1 Tax=Spongospora subterranea TaxID=70186 RepID=A0A0H5R3P3_9EUKA|eukprot:CRZ08521.1 hypothetical protein [Spongospora subterranea]
MMIMGEGDNMDLNLMITGPPLACLFRSFDETAFAENSPKLRKELSSGIETAPSGRHHDGHGIVEPHHLFPKHLIDSVLPLIWTSFNDNPFVRFTSTWIVVCPDNGDHRV